MSSLRQQLSDGIECLGLSTSVCDDQIDQLLNYVLLLEKWNGAYNLTAVRDPAAMVSRHLLDSLSIVPFVAPLDIESVVDVGTGPGLPGIPLAIVCPHLSFTLLDSNGKKTRFLFQAQQQLGLANVTEINSRVEQFAPLHPFDLITSRAFSSLHKMLEGCGHLCHQSSHFFAMKGVYPHQELRELPKHYTVLNTYPIAVPGVAEERHLVDIIPTP